MPPPGLCHPDPEYDASPFDVSGNLWGGVRASGVDNSRNVFAEQAVWSANEQAGQSTQEASSLSALQNFFDVSGTSGVPASLSSLYSAFSAWSSNPTDNTSRQQVISAATNFAQSVQQMATNVEQLRTQTDAQLSGTVSNINSLTSQIATINGEIQSGNGADAGLQAQLYNTIEQLSNLAPINVSTTSDGTALCCWEDSRRLSWAINRTRCSDLSGSRNPTNANATPDAQLLTSAGTDVTALASQGSWVPFFHSATRPCHRSSATVHGKAA